jgi:hypothetical protein
MLSSWAITKIVRRECHAMATIRLAAGRAALQVSTANPGRILATSRFLRYMRTCSVDLQLGEHSVAVVVLLVADQFVPAG